MFWILFMIAVCVPLIGFYTIWRDARAPHQWAWISDESLKMYVDAAKTFLTASGIAAVVVASLGGKFSPPSWIVQRAIAGLVTCVVFAPITVLVLYRLYDRARSRHQMADPKDAHAQGKLTRLELALLLLVAYITAEGFILGFLYLGRIPFHPAP